MLCVHSSKKLSADGDTEGKLIKLLCAISAAGFPEVSVIRMTVCQKLIGLHFRARIPGVDLALQPTAKN